MNERSTRLTSGPPLRRIVGFSLPLTVANLCQQGYLLVDGIVVGRLLGVDALAGVGAAGPLYYLLSATFIGASTAFTIRLAQLLGAGRSDRTRAVAVALLLFTVSWSLACAGLMVAGGGPVLAAMGLTGAVAGAGRTFLLVLAAGLPSIFGLAGLTAYLRGQGDPRTPMYLLIGSSVLNAGLSWLFVGPLRLGVAGAAAATGTAATLALLAGLARIRRPAGPGRPAGPASVTDRAAVPEELRGAARLGLPLAAQHIVLALGIMVLVRIIEPFGAAFLAAFTVAGRLELFAAMVFLDLSGALATFAAQNLGAGRTDRVRAGLRSATWLAAVVAGVLGAVLVAARAPLAGLFTDDPAARGLTEHYILITYPFFLLYAVMVVLHGHLNGSGHTVVPLICTVLAFVSVQVPAAYLLSGPFGIDGVIWSVVAGWAVGLAYTVHATRRRLPPPPPPPEPEPAGQESGTSSRARRIRFSDTG